MVNRLLKYLLIIYTFLLPVQTRLFLVDSGLEYQRISLYGTQILFFIILIAYFFCHSRVNGNPNSKNKEEQSVISTDPDAMSGERRNPFPMNWASRKGSLDYARDDRFFLFSFLDSGSKAGMTVFLLVVCFVAVQLLNTSRFDLVIQTLLWIIQIIAFIWIVRREKLEQVVLWTFIGSMTLQSIFIWVQVFTQYIPAFKWLGLAEQLSSVGGVSVMETAFGRFLRGYGSFSHPNIAGGYLLIAILAMKNFQFSIFNFQSSSNNENIKSKTNYYLLFTNYLIASLLVSALVLTFSRSAMLGLIIFIISQCIYALSSRSFIWDQNNKNKQKKNFGSFCFDFLDSGSKTGMTIFLLFVVLAVAIPFRGLIFSRTNISNRLESKSIVERQLYSDQAKEIIKNNLWFGVGLGNYTVELQKQYPNREAYEYQPPHNVFILIFSELGIVGLIIVGCFVLLWFRITYPRIGTSSVRSMYILCILSNSFNYPITILFSLLPILLFDHYPWSFYTGSVLLALWFVSYSFKETNITI